MQLDENPISKKYREYSLKLHIGRLKEIRTRGSNRIDNTSPKTIDLLLQKKQRKEFIKKEKINDIEKDNKKLIEILTEISLGKRESITQKMIHSTKDTPNPKSLNNTFRKKEALRIIEDNEALIRRIQKTTAELSLQKLNKEWAIVSKYKSTISRKTPRYGSAEVVTSHLLPPIHGSAHEVGNFNDKSQRHDVNNNHIEASPPKSSRNNTNVCKKSKKKRTSPNKALSVSNDGSNKPEELVESEPKIVNESSGHYTQGNLESGDESKTFEKIEKNQILDSKPSFDDLEKNQSVKEIKDTQEHQKALDEIQGIDFYEENNISAEVYLDNNEKNKFLDNTTSIIDENESEHLIVLESESKEDQIVNIE
jgi:Hemingway/CFA97